jgi:hypothetical protein
MTSRVSPRLRQIFRMMAAEFDVKLDELQLISHRSMVARFKGLALPAERLKVWENLRKEYGEPEVEC